MAPQMASARLQTVGLVLAFLVIGGVAYYSFTIANQLNQRNSSLQAEVSALQGDIANLQSSLQSSQSSSGIIQANNTKLFAAMQTALADDDRQLAVLGTELALLRSGNASMAARIAVQLQNLTASVHILQSYIHSASPPIFLRTSGTALASFVERPDELIYLRLTATGPNSIAEAAIGSRAFNASIAGNTVSWKAVANPVAADGNHWFWPMVLENSPGGTNAIEFEQAAGAQEVAVVYNGNRTIASVAWNPLVVHTFKIEIVTPGKQVDFYIDGNIVFSMNTAVPLSEFLIQGAEVKAVGGAAPGVAMVDAYGGMLGAGPPL